MAESFDRILLLKYQEELNHLGTLRCRVVSESMCPVIRAGEFVTVKKQRNLSELRRFDILVFLHGEKLYCHYFWALNKQPNQAPICTRSIRAIYQNDIPVSPDEVLGRVVDKTIPLWTRTRIVLMNFLRGGA